MRVIRLNIGIIGCGFIAKKHVEAIRNIPGARLTAVCDQIEAAMQQFVKEFNATPYTNVKDMLSDSNVDLVCICTPSGLHADIAELAAQYGKHMIVEKPIAMTLEDSERIMAAARINNVKLSVVHPNRFRPVSMKMKEILDNRLLGEISHALCIVNWNRGQEYYDQSSWRGTKQFDGGVLMNQAIHNLDLLLWYLGRPVEVFSMEATRIHRIEAEDVSTGIIKFESGALATVQASTNVYSRNYEESITIFGEKGTVKIGGTNALYFQHIDIEGCDEDTLGKWIDDVKSDPWGTPGHEQILQDLIQAIEEDREPAVTGEDGKNAVQIVLSFYESAKQNQPITLYEGSLLS